MNLPRQDSGSRKTASHGGFTLIELMVVVVIVSILSIIAIPSYSSYVARGKIAEAHSLLADYRVRIEQYYQDNRNYGAANGNCGAVAPPQQNSYLALACTVGNTDQTYIASATSNANQGLGAAGDYRYTVNESNAKATTKFKGSAMNKACWLLKGSEC